MRFEGCQSVTVRDLYAQNNIARVTKNSKRLNGVLSFYDCPEVLVSNTSLKCTASPRKTSTCITVAPRKEGEEKHQFSDVRSVVRIENCNLDVGDHQVGLLLVNTDDAQVSNNRVITLQATTPATQGIVIAGSIAENIKITNNTIQNTLQGIHIGLSHHEKKLGNPDLIGNLIIQGNTIHISLPNISQRLEKTRHGIFVGNCKSLVIENNHISLTRYKSSTNLRVDGIKVYGILGDRLIICQNHLTGTNTLGGFSGEGISLKNLRTSSSPPLIKNNFIKQVPKSWIRNNS